MKTFDYEPFFCKTAEKTSESGTRYERTSRKRIEVLLQIAYKMDEKLDEFIALEVENNGKTRRVAESVASEAADTFRY